jgi:F420-non-reducing hydrogenase iron-sulfur subunit
MGIEEDRLDLQWVSASEGKKFAEVANTFTETIKKLGPCKAKSVAETLVR